MGTVIQFRYAHFGSNLEACLKAERGHALYDESLAAACQEFEETGFGDAEKNPEIMKRALGIAREKDAVCGTLEALVRAIWLSLKGDDPTTAIH